MSPQLVVLLTEPSGAVHCTFMCRRIVEHGFVIRECLLALAQLLIRFGAPAERLDIWFFSKPPRIVIDGIPIIALVEIDVASH
jgi:hypothetical protein